MHNPDHFQRPSEPHLLAQRSLATLNLLTLPEDRKAFAKVLKERGHKILGCGTYAVVIEHPEDRNIAIRISCKDDGWIGYALQNQGSQYAPRLHEIGHHDGVWISITERLEPIQASNCKHVAAMSAIDSMVMMHKRKSKRLPLDKFDECELELHRRWDGLGDFLRQFLNIEDCDLREANIMMRGSIPVANDPVGEMDKKMAQGLETQWRCRS